MCVQVEFQILIELSVVQDGISSKRQFDLNEVDEEDECDESDEFEEVVGGDGDGVDDGDVSSSKFSCCRYGV